jgi:hypothetical protein
VAFDLWCRWQRPLTLCVLGPRANAQDADRPKQILVLNATRPDEQFSVVAAREMPKLLAEGIKQRVDYYTEYFDYLRFRYLKTRACTSTSCVGSTKEGVSISFS